MALKKNDIELIIIIMQLVIKYGWPFVANLIANIGKEEITIEDLKATRIEDDEPFIP